MSYEVEVFANKSYAQEVAQLVAREIPHARSVVLTGGTTAEKVYEPMGDIGVDWPNSDVLFSDERCVPPQDDASNFGMVARLLVQLDRARVHRMRGEDEPEAAARGYSDEIRPLVDAGLELMLIGMGADGHICALFPGSPALEEKDRLCAAVDRPEGLRGLTLTPPAVLSARRILLLVTSNGKAATVAKAVHGADDPVTLPVRLLRDHPDATFLLDRSAASQL
ncbi:MAG: 6-phosphogluconolactonase [Actinomycetota bacterium]